MIYVACQQSILDGLNITSCSIDTAFTVVSGKLLDWLEGKVTVSRIRIACFANANTEMGIGYPEDLKQKMMAAKSVTELFEILVLHPTHWSWINIQVMEKISSVNNQARDLVEYYKTIISNKKVRDVIQKIPQFEIDNSFYTKVKEKWKKSLDDITLKDIQNHQTHIAEIFGINKSATIVADIISGCVEVHWLMPTMLVHYAKDNFHKNKYRLLKFDIISLEFTVSGMYVL